MTVPPPTTIGAHIQPKAAPRRTSLFLRVLRRPKGWISLSVLLVIVVGCLGAALWAPYDPIANDLSNSLAAPSWQHLLGTDQLGRDVFSRILYGGIPAFLAAFQVAIVGIVLSVPLGLFSGYVGGRTDQIIMRFVDFGLAIPNLIFVLVVLSIFGENLPLAYLVLGILLVPTSARIIRGAALAVRGELYIDAARVSGVSTPRIVFRHVLPRVIGPILVQASLLFAVGVLITAGLAYLGFGPEPPDPSWGGLVAESLALLYRSPWLMIGIGTVMAAVVMALGLLGDVIQDETVDAWSPAYRPPRRLRRTAAATSDDRSTEALLDVRGLQIAYQRSGSDVIVADDVSFTLQKGEILGVVGESGCGKTTVARAILGLLRGTGRVTAGEIRLGDIRLDLLSAEDFRKLRGNRIGFVSQEPMSALDPTLTVGAIVASNVRLHTGTSKAEARKRTIELFRLVQLRNPEAVYKLYPHQVSGGMAQRIAIARALAGSPDLLVADEPTTALDVSVQAEVLDLLREIRERTGMAILLITHDWGVVSEVCDRAIVMYAGQIVEAAPVQKLVEAPLHPYTKALLRSNPSLAPEDATRLPTVPGTIPRPEDWPVSCHFANRCPLAVEACRTGAIPLFDLEPGRQSRCIRVDDVPAAEFSIEGTVPDDASSLLADAVTIRAAQEGSR